MKDNQSVQAILQNIKARAVYEKLKTRFPGRRRKIGEAEQGTSV
jgi:hypothetical protein